MNKLELAHQMALAMQSREPIVDMKLVATLCFDYAEAMLAEDERRKDKSLPDVLQDEFEVDWSQAPDDVTMWRMTGNGDCYWGVEADCGGYSIPVPSGLAPTFGYKGCYTKSLRKRPK